jgi:hypothetical protein
VEHAGHADGAAQQRGIGGEGGQGGSGLFEKKIITQLLVTAEEVAELRGDGKGNKMTGHGQEACFLPCLPLGGAVAAAGIAGAVPAGDGGRGLRAAAVAAVKYGAAGGRAAAQDGLRGTHVRPRHGGSVPLRIAGPEAPEDICEGDHCRRRSTGGKSAGGAQAAPMSRASRATAFWVCASLTAVKCV